MAVITLEKVRQGSDIRIRARLIDNGVAVDWSGLSNVVAMVYSDEQRVIAGPCSVSIDPDDSLCLVCRYEADKPQYLGVNSLVIRCEYKGQKKTYDRKAFEIVSRTEDLEGEEMVLEDPELTVELEVEEVSTSLLDKAIDAALAAAGEALEATKTAQEGENSRQEGETLREEAEAARRVAETARTEAEAARAEAERARDVAEQARAAAEELRDTAEQAREAAEAARQGAEAQRAQAEQAREKAEDAREVAELQRDRIEAERQAAERERMIADGARTEAENKREADFREAVAETQSATAETKTATANADAATAKAKDATAAALDAKASVEQMSFGLAGIVLEEGELKLVQNAEAGTFVGGAVTEDGALELEFES